MKDLEEALAKKQQVIDDASYKPASGTHESPQGNTENIYHWTECHYEKKRVNWGKLNWETKEWWTYTPHFRKTLYDADLTEANSDVQTTYNACDAALKTLNISTTNLENAIATANARVHDINSLHPQLASNHASLKHAKAEMTRHLTSMNNEQRACIIGEKCGSPGSETEHLVQEIDRLGFNPEIAASFAISKQNIRLMDLVIKHKAALDTNLTDGKTLLQLAVATKNADMIEKTIRATPQCETSLLYAAAGEDLETIDSILKIYPAKACDLLLGELSVLHYAIAQSNHAIVNCILQRNSSAIKVTNSNGDNAFKIALRSGDENTIKLIARHFDVQRECDSMVHAHEQDLVSKALNANLITTSWLTSVDPNMLLDLTGANKVEDSVEFGS